MVSRKTGTINPELGVSCLKNGSFGVNSLEEGFLLLSLLRPFLHYQIIVVAFNLVIKSSKFGPEAARLEFIAFNGPHGTDD